MPVRKLFLLSLFLFPIGAWAQAPVDSLQKEEGRFKTYYPNGKLLLKGKYKNSLRQGSWQYYTEKGLLIKQERYRKGQLRWTFHFNEKGKLTRIIDWKGRETKKSGCGC